MAAHEVDVHEFNVIVALLGGLVLMLGLGSRRLARGVLPPSLLALAAGVLAGPHVLGLLDVSVLADEALLREKVARLTLGVALVGVALRIPKEFVREHCGTPPRGADHLAC
ncbi:MAG TPA: hypothetical protein VK912_02365 [Longimicrobiales bacterium]|nr:hypothetical protein [Longimicrobiales bacterium]